MTREQYDALIKAFNDAIANIPKPECYEDYTVDIGEHPSKAEWTKWALHRWNNDEAFVPYTWGNNVNPEVDMPKESEATNIGEMLRSMVGKTKDETDFPFNKMYSTTDELRTLKDHWKKVAYQMRDDRNMERVEVELLKEAIKENNEAHHETHKYLREAKEQITEMQATIDHLRKEWGRTIDRALRYEDKLLNINEQYPGILGDEELKALMTHPE